MVKRSREDSPPSSSSSPISASSSTFEPITGSSRLVETSLHSSKYLQVSPEVSAPAGVMKCSLPPHQETLSFSTFEEFEVHYAKSHANRCSECRRNFPTEHFLGLHIGENHDPLGESRRDKGEKTVLLNQPLFRQPLYDAYPSFSITVLSKTATKSV
jgi:hypothetical protein